ncbi:DUF3576 domain-containing protein [Roseovarius sp.]
MSDRVMTKSRIITLGLSLGCAVTLVACDSIRNEGFRDEALNVETGRDYQTQRRQDGSFLDFFRNEGVGVNVNRFLWTASLDVLDFLPVQTADPFTGIISTGYGTPPGGGQSYRATILISDPALDARSLNVALQTRGGPVNAATQRAVEDAILARARQLRINAGNF